MPNKLTNLIYPIASFTLWGTLFFATRFTVDLVSISALGFLRFLIAVIPLYILCKKKYRLVQIKKKDYKYFFLIGLLGYYFNIVFNIAGVKYAGASLGALITMLNPFLISIFAALILKEKLTKRKVICLLMTTAGVYIVLAGNTITGKLIGVIFVFISVVNWSIASVFMRKMAVEYESLPLTCYCMLFSLFFHTPAFIIDVVFFNPLHLTWQLFLWILYMGLACTCLTMLLWNKSLQIYDAATCSLFFPLQVFVSAFLSGLLLNETINSAYYIGFILCTCSIILNFISKPKDSSSLSSNLS